MYIIEEKAWIFFSPDFEVLANSLQILPFGSDEFMYFFLFYSSRKYFPFEFIVIEIEGKYDYFLIFCILKNKGVGR